MEHMAATIIALGDAHFQLLTASSSAKSFLHALETSYHNVTG
jgi:uroporphyrinogen-III synthase